MHWIHCFNKGSTFEWDFNFRWSEQYGFYNAYDALHLYIMIMDFNMSGEYIDSVWNVRLICAAFETGCNSESIGIHLQIPHLRPAEYKRSRLSRNRRTVNRAYGGVLSGGAVRERFVLVNPFPYKQIYYIDPNPFFVLLYMRVIY